jgi:hypothetical protein
MTKKQPEQDEARGSHDKRTPRRQSTRQADWDDAEIVINIEHTTPGTPLDDHLRKEQTRALLELLAAYLRGTGAQGDDAPASDERHEACASSKDGLWCLLATTSRGGTVADNCHSGGGI